MWTRTLPVLTSLLLIITARPQLVQAQTDGPAMVYGAHGSGDWRGGVNALRPDASGTNASELQHALRVETDRLVQAAAALARAATGSERAALDATLLDVARRREAAMTALMEAAPERAVESAMRASQREQLPALAREHVERAVTEAGTLEVLGILSDDGARGMERYLVADDRRLRLFVDRLSDEYMTGTAITVNGILLAGRLAALADAVTVHQAVTAEDVRGPGVPVRSALVININFQDLATEPWTIDFVNNLFVNTIGPWYEEGSYGQTSMVADATGWFTIAASSATCATTTFRTQAEAAARAVGYDPNSYHHVVIAFPRVAACRWAGLAQVGGRYSWLNNAMRLSVTVHELGHNLGLLHSRSRRCSEGPLTGTCASAEYGDRFDVMGSGGQAHYHASYRAHLGWIPSADVITVTPESMEVVVTLRSAATSFGPRVLRVRRGGANEYLHVEVREAVGFDSVLGQYQALLNGVAVYLGTLMRSQWIIDIGYTTTTVADAPLQFGETLYDTDGDVSITPLYTEDGETYVHVYYGLGAR